MNERETNRLAVPVNERDHVLGPANAAVTVVNYGDYECPDCQKRHRVIDKMVYELLDKVRLIHRHFPLVKVHPHSLRAAEAAEAAGAQGRFWEMSRLLYLNPSKLEDKDLRKYAKESGLDLKKFDEEMSSGLYAEQILKDRYISLINGITGTPTTFINEVRYAMGGLELIDVVKDILRGQRAAE
jgi:protein-disulfide isomerase